MPDRPGLPFVQAELLRHAEQLKGFIQALLADRDAAEDCFQEVFIAVTAKAADFKPGTDFLAWVRAIARFKVLQYVGRGRRRHECQLDPETVSLLADESEPFAADWDEMLSSLSRCLERLSPTARQLIDARYAHGLQPSAIAAASGRSANGVTVALAKARTVLEKCVGRAHGQAER